MCHQAFIAIGSNLGDRQAYYRQALERIAALPDTHIIRQSSQYETEPLGEASTWYLNGVIEIETDLAADPLLQHLQSIENALGRVRSTERWVSRTMDLDILFFDTQIIETPDLYIPHPELHNRRFVLEPLTEIAPAFLHPRLQRTVSDLLAQLHDKKRVIALPSRSS